jgi:Dna[CI] antecedent, DciA
MQPLSQAIPKVLGDLLRSTPHSPGKVEFAWVAVVGPAMGRVTRVRLEGHVLIIEGDTPSWTREVSRSSGLIVRRLNAMLGADTVQQVIIRA